MKALPRSLRSLLLAVAACVALGSVSAAEQPKPESLPSGLNMYVIERTMPGLGKLTPAELKAASQKSCGVLRDLGGQVTWLQSYCTGDKMFCVYLAPNEAMVREHAQRGGFPADAVLKVNTIISPKTAE
ncbi:MAG: DUF4242 domain-containing protein [Candidatus Didemnitutus sp.]|nr:DUF4242 domain-containing protein [Candidatus Didemnitutus sp.]